MGQTAVLLSETDSFHLPVPSALGPAMEEEDENKSPGPTGAWMPLPRDNSTYYRNGNRNFGGHLAISSAHELITFYNGPMKEALLSPLHR